MKSYQNEKRRRRKGCYCVHRFRFYNLFTCSARSLNIIHNNDLLLWCYVMSWWCSGGGTHTDKKENKFMFYQDRRIAAALCSKLDWAWPGSSVSIRQNVFGVKWTCVFKRQRIDHDIRACCLVSMILIRHIWKRICKHILSTCMWIRYLPSE